jgi:glycosyltransferase involved in cell wall biosynthesis
LRPFVSHIIGRFPGDKFYSFWFSLLNAFFLSLSVSSLYLFFVVIILWLFSDIRHNGIGSIISDSAHCIEQCIEQYGKRLSSHIVNYSIYYFRKYILHWSEEKNRGIYYASWLVRKEKKEYGTIALVNLNFDKYTETYVKGHYEKLPFKCEYYYGDPFPIYHAIDGNLISNYSSLRTIKKCYHFLVSKKEEDLLLAHFQQKKISLILAEFGTTAVTLTDISARSGIPLIVIFYGYDIWHSAVLNRHIDGYKKLFAIASKVIGVSNDICRRLSQLGCATEKIEYLPCYANLDLFQYTDHSRNPPVFLSVGRFSETKSPHLTILAFKEVLQTIPDARLVMVGKDGGGELFESCIILTKALGIEHQVEFAGIQPPHKIYDYMKQARVFVQHSLITPLYGDKEGTPVAIIEAMACGLPVVATRHAGIAELITHGENGILVDEYNYHAMANAMTELCKNDYMVYELGRNAASAIRNNPLIKENIVKLTEMIFQYKLKA